MQNNTLNNQASITAEHTQSQTISLNGNSPAWLTNFITIYQQLGTDNLALLTELYHPKITFTDPMHQIEGLPALKDYFAKLYQNLSSCEFIINKVLVDGDEASVYWQMTYQHPNLNRGKPVTVEGCSLIKGQGDKVIYHRDYLDLGAMLYEQLPILGKVIKWLKHKAAR